MEEITICGKTLDEIDEKVRAFDKAMGDKQIRFMETHPGVRPLPVYVTEDQYEFVLDIIDSVGEAETAAKRCEENASSEEERAACHERFIDLSSLLFWCTCRKLEYEGYLR